MRNRGRVNLNCRRYRRSSIYHRLVHTTTSWGLVLLACLFVTSVLAQVEGPEPPPAETPASQTAPDPFLLRITAALAGVTTRDLAALAKALGAGKSSEGGSFGTPPNQLTPVGDLNADGVPDMLLRWAITEGTPGVESAPDPDSAPLWAVYLLSWDGARWKASRLLPEVEDFTPSVVNLGPSVGRSLALVVLAGGSQIAYPVLFQVKDHSASLLWDAQADDSRYTGPFQSQVSFRGHAATAAEMIVTGRVDPGFLQVDPHGRRGFQMHATYRWDGKAFVPVKTEYLAGPDYTIYRFISALHLHDYASAYALVDPPTFLKAGPRTLEAFRHFIQANWPEFLQDEVFQAPEPPAGSSDDHFFVLEKPDKHYVYHPAFSIDGRFLLTDLTRTQVADD